MDFEPTVSAGAHLAVTEPPGGTVIRANGHITNAWRGAYAHVRLEMDKGDADTFVDDYKVKGNNQITLTPGLQDSGGGETGVTHHVGFLAQAPAQLEGATRTVFNLSTRDGFLELERHYWWRLGNMTGFYWGTVFRRILNECAIPDSKIYIYNRTAGELQTYTAWAASGDASPQITYAQRRGELRFEFGPETGIIDATNQLADSVGWIWGVDQSGNWFTKPPVEYDPDSGVDWTLDEDELATNRGITFNLEASPTFDATPAGKPFVNSVYVRIDEDEAWVTHTASRIQGSAANFIGAEWQEVVIGEDHQSAQALADAILQERAGLDTNRSSRERTIRWSHECLDGDTGPYNALQLMPDMFVKLQVTGLGVTNNSIYQITSKDWTVEGGPDLRYRASFEAKFVKVDT